MVICDRLRELRESKNLPPGRHRKKNGTLPLLCIPRGEWSLGSRCRDLGKVRSCFGGASLIVKKKGGPKAAPFLSFRFQF